MKHIIDVYLSHWENVDRTGLIRSVDLQKYCETELIIHVET